MPSTLDQARPQPATMRARTSFQRTNHGHSLLRVRNHGDWPAGEFRDYIEALMRNAGIPHAAELARRAGIDASLISKWLNGRQQPSRPNLKKVAAPLRVAPVNLYLMAGLDEEEDLEISGQFDLSTIGPELRELLDLDRDEATSTDERSLIREVAATLVAGIRARRLAGRDRTISRRRSA